jgi:hypothetical protein
MKLAKRNYPDRRPWSGMGLMEARFFVGLKTRERDVARSTIKFAKDELRLGDSTIDERVGGFFRRLAQTLAAQPQDRLDYFRKHLEQASKELAK